jgi:DNA-binding SARP family transcriptional activator/TolB-like protein
MSGAAAQRSRLALLALLGAAGPTGISRDRLLLYLWPESDTERARHALKQAVYSLRRDLGNDDVIVGTATLTLNPALVELDLGDFEAAIARNDDDAAVAVYAGPFLDGVYVKDAAEFERWTAEQRARLAHDWCTAVERLATHAEAGGDWRAAIQWRRRLAAAEPLSGRFNMALMRAHAESGDVAGAVQHFRVHEALVREELGAAPEADVVALAEAMRSGAWQRSATIPPTARATPPGGTIAAVSAAPLSAAPLSAAPLMPATDMASPAGVKLTVEAAPLTRPAGRRRRAPLFAAAALLLVVGLSTAFSTTTRALWGGLLGRPRITRGLYVVAPLENETGDSTLNWFGEVAADAIGEGLRLDDISVVDALTAIADRRYLRARMPSSIPPRELAIAIADSLGAATAIVGLYHRDGDSLRVSVNVVDIRSRKVQMTVSREGAVKGTGMTTLANRLGNAVLGSIRQSKDTTAEANAIRLVPTDSPQAFVKMSAAYGYFWQNPADTTGAFNLLAEAEATDPAYTAPLLLRGYIYDVKQQWPATADVVRKLELHKATLSLFGRQMLDVFEADLRGDAAGRVRAAREVMRLTPKNNEMALLVVLSTLYVGKPDDALAALRYSEGAPGLNARTAISWQWRSAAEHEVDSLVAERLSAAAAYRGFKSTAMAITTRARVLATAGDPANLDSLRTLLREGIPTDSNPRAAQLDLMVLAARELRHHHPTLAAADSLFSDVLARQGTPTPESSRSDRFRYALVLYDLRRDAEARPLFAALHAADPRDLQMLGRLGAIAVRQGDSAEATRIRRQLGEVKEGYRVGMATAWQAHMAAAAGNLPEAIRLLRVAVQRGYRLMDLGDDTVHLDRDFVELSTSKEYAAFRKELADTVIP